MENLSPMVACMAGTPDIERGERLKEWRIRAGLSQEDVARRLDPPVSTKTIFNWENGGGIHGRNKRALAELYGRSVEELEGFVEAPEPFALAEFIDSRLDEFRSAVTTILAHMAEQDREREAIVSDVQQTLQAIQAQATAIETLAARIEVLYRLQEAGSAVAALDEGHTRGGGGKAPVAKGRRPVNRR